MFSREAEFLISDSKEISICIFFCPSLAFYHVFFHWNIHTICEKLQTQVKSLSLISFLSLFPPSLVGMSHVADAPPLCAEMGEGKRGWRAMKERCDWGQIGEEEEEAGRAGRCAALKIHSKHMHFLFSSTTSAALKLPALSSFFSFPDWLSFKEEEAVQTSTALPFVVSPERISFMSSETFLGPQRLVTRDSWICASAGQMLITVRLSELFLQLVWYSGSASGPFHSGEWSCVVGEMRAEVLAVWVSLTLCCALVWTREDVKENKLSSRQIQVREAQGLIKHWRQRVEGDTEMSDEPAAVVGEETTKPKKKKTPEEIEAGK